MTVQLNVGYIGKTRAGERVEIVRNDGFMSWTFVGNNNLTYTKDGSTDVDGNEVSGDIIGPWEDAPEVGEWLGWNGGPCPVHPETVVQTRHLSTGYPKTNSDNYKASHQDWDNIIAYRIITPYVEPKKAREFWVDPDRCISVASYHAGFVHVREVLDEGDAE